MKLIHTYRHPNEPNGKIQVYRDRRGWVVIERNEHGTNMRETRPDYVGVAKHGRGYVVTAEYYDDRPGFEILAEFKSAEAATATLKGK